MGSRRHPAAVAPGAAAGYPGGGTAAGLHAKFACLNAPFSLHFAHMSESTANAVLLPGVAAAGPDIGAVAARESSPSAADVSAADAGSVPPWAQPGLALLIVIELLLLAFLPPAFMRYVSVKHIYNFHVVGPLGADGKPKLLRCGQLSETGLDAAIRPHGIKTVVNLRYGAEDPGIGNGVTEKTSATLLGAKIVYMPVADVVEQHTVALPRQGRHRPADAGAVVRVGLPQRSWTTRPTTRCCCTAGSASTARAC